MSHATNSISLSMAGWGGVSAAAVAMPLGGKGWLLQLTPSVLECTPCSATTDHSPSQEFLQKAIGDPEENYSGLKKDLVTML